ncbi:MAG: hypothetical protein M1822_008433 [Bathelium mastoideum]|nr:MAG: hypothetical protein M1822_008433 [Bathelium mastoideum]
MPILGRQLYILDALTSDRHKKVFEIQTAALRHELGSSHTYDFVEGLRPSEMDRGISSISASDGEYFKYYEPYDSTSFRKALDDLGKYLDTDGPFDGVIAFSQGCSLAAAFIIEEQRRQVQAGNGDPASASSFKCAVFFAGRPPYVDAGPEHRSLGGKKDAASSGSFTMRIAIPTAHIWGANDEFEPGNALALYDLCGPQTRCVVVHEGGHEVPGPRDRDAVTESVHAIKRMLAKL